MLEASNTHPALHAARPAVRRDAPPSTTQNIDETVVFDGSAGAIIRHILRNVLATILTFGLYAFWGKTRLRRHFLGHTVFLGSRLEYGGSGLRLLAGHIGGLGALGGLTGAFAYTLANPAILTGLPLHPPIAIAGACFLYFVSMLYVFHFAAFRAGRYLLSRIEWRGFNTVQTGSAFGYAIRAVPFSLLVILTLGLAYPFMRNRLQGYKINHARFGNETLHYHGDSDPLFRCWLLPWSIGVALIAGILIALETQIRSIVNANWLENTNMPVYAWNAFVEEETWLVLSGLILFSLAMHWYRSVESVHFAINTTLARLRFVSRLTHADFLIAWVNSIVLVAILGAVIVATFMAVGTATVALAAKGATVGITLAALIFLSLTVIALLLGSVRWLILHNLLAGASYNGLAIKGRIALDRLVVNPPASEGLRREPTLNVNSARPADEDEAAEPRLIVNNRV